MKMKKKLKLDMRATGDTKTQHKPFPCPSNGILPKASSSLSFHPTMHFLIYREIKCHENKIKQ
jgi:hypothetical protein